MSERYDAFLSYARADLEFASSLAAGLSALGLQVFYEEARVASGAPLARALHDAIARSAHVLVVMSPA